MAIFTNAATLTGGATNDYVLGDSATVANTLNGGDGNDYILGDADTPITMTVLAGAGTSSGNAFAINADSTFWSRLYNPDVANSTTIPHATAIIEGNGSYQWFAVTVVGGQILTLDADYGVGTDLELRIFQADGTTLVTSNNNATAITDGANGSTSVNDSFLTFTAPGNNLTSTTYLIRVGEADGSPVDATESYMLNMSLTEQSTDSPASGNDDLYGGNGDDIMYGIGGNDKLYGGAGNDYMTGDEGNDTLDGGAGNDTMYGGNNNDTFVVTNLNNTAGDKIYGGLLTDTLDLSALTGVSNVLVNLATGSFTATGASSITTIVDVENVIGTAFNDTIIGSDANNTLNGGAGDDSLTGGLGTDNFIGGLGNDTFFTNSSSENVTEAAGEGTADRVIASSTFSLTAGSAVEFIQTDNAAGITAINLTGNALAQTITGNAANNSLNDGGAGAADTLIGGAGNDTYNVNNTGTIVTETVGNGTADRVSTSVTFALAAGSDIESLTTSSSTGTTAINLTGNALRQTITGNDGDNVLNTGGAGAADALTGNGGNDTYIINNAADTISEIANDGTADRVQTNVSYVLGSATDIEFMETTNAAGTGAINLTGSSIAQTLTGNAGANVLDGKLGNDTLVGGAGNDIFAFSTTGGVANTDTISGFVAADDQIELNTSVFTTLTVASGAVNSSNILNASAFATNTFTTAAQRVMYNSTTGVLTYDSNGSDVGGTTFQFATLTGAPTISAADISVAVPGSGAGGNVITGTSGNDSAATTGTANADTIYGLAGNDTLTGGLGNDLSYGGTGNDIYVVQGSGDVVSEFAGEGTLDTVRSESNFVLTAASEVEVIETTNAAGVAAINLTGNTLAQTIVGNAGANSLDDGGTGAADTLTGGAGNDTYIVSNAATIINEGTGGGTFDRVASRVSFVLAADDNIESLSTTSSAGTGAINLTGNALAQSINGNNGDNILDSTTGAADVMTGFLGNDTYLVRNAGDVVAESSGQGTLDSVLASVSFVLDSSDDIESLRTTSFSGTSAINLTGNGLGQTIVGNAGSNILDGKTGNDTMTGGAGTDIFAFSSTLGATNIDTITDFNVVDDQIRLDPVAFAALTVASGTVGTNGVLSASAFATNAFTTNAQRIMYNTTSGALTYDSNGSDAGGTVFQFATLTGAPAITAADINVILPPLVGNTINGTAGDDNLVGTGAVDIINGLAGNDTLSGGLGNDVNFGGAGNDIYVVEGSGDIVNEVAGEGTNDRVFAQGTYALLAGSQVEAVQTTSFAGVAAINLTGNTLAQSIIGNAGNNVLDDGGAGAADTMTGSIGNDTYYVSNAGTIIVESTGGGTTDRVAARVSFALAADDDVESLTTTTSSGTTSINLTGNALAQSIVGNNGANILDSVAGAADTMTGLLGNDIYLVRNLGDIIVEAAGQGLADEVRVAFNYALDASDDIEILATANDAGVTAQNLTGNAVAQTIIGNAGVNTLNDGGGAGADTLTGLGGNDLYLVNNAGTSVIEAASGGTDVVTATTSFTLAAGSEVETIQTSNASGVTVINFTGNALAQSITGNQAANTLNDGAAGAADTLTGLDGNDIYVVNNAGTIIVEGVGTGTADEVRATVSFALAADDDIEILATNSAAGTSAINLTGNALAQTITGNAGNNVLDSGVGAVDTMAGGAGNDTYLLRNVGDTLTETAGNGSADEVRVGFSYALVTGADIEILSTDNAAGTTALTLTGNELGQTINSNAGVNTLVGLGGDDTYTVNNAATVVTEAASGGTDRVNASVSYTLGAGQEIEVLATTNDAGAAALTLTGNELGQTIIGNAGASTLIGLGGNDIYTVNSATTIVTEAASGGSDTVNSNVSFVLSAGSEVEILQTTNAAGNGSINLTGNALAQTINGNAGNNILDGGVGASDVLNGLAGNDVYFLRNAGDTFAETAGNGTADEVRVGFSYTLLAAADIEILSTDNAALTTAINLTGNILGQTINGNAGANTLSDGGAGASDTLIGLAGADIYLVNNTGTIVTEAASGGSDTITSSVTYTLGAGSEIEFLQTSNAAGTGAINFTGNALAQTITGNAGINTLSDGGAGASDTLIGLAGNDIYTVNNLATVVTEAAAGGTDTVNASVSYTLGAGQEIEFLATDNAAGNTALNLTGNLLAQTITGNAGINTLSDGGAGAADTLIGLQGNDTYLVNNTGTIVTEAAAGGSDTITSSVTYSLSVGSEIEFLQTSSAAGTGAINFTGNILAQTITGNAGVNTLSDGGAGAADTLVGLAGNDVYVVNNTGTVITEAAASGSDTVQTSVNYVLAAGVEVETFTTTNGAGTGALNLTGNAFAQSITGNAGVNFIDGKDGNDVLAGGQGSDTFVFTTALNATTNLDTISDFGTTISTNDDQFQLATAIFTTLGATFTAADFVANATGAITNAAQNIIYNTATGALFYDADGITGGSIQFATLTGNPTLTFSDFSMI